MLTNSSTCVFGEILDDYVRLKSDCDSVAESYWDQGGLGPLKCLEKKVVYI